MQKGNTYQRVRRAVMRETAILIAGAVVLALFVLLFAAAGAVSR